MRYLATPDGRCGPAPGTPGAVPAQDQTTRTSSKRYWECMERNDLDQIRELLWYHHNVERVDASIYGLPKDDFDDRSLLTIEERLDYRAGARPPGRDESCLATSGPVQYPHHLREALDHYYEVDRASGPTARRSSAASGVDFRRARGRSGSGWAIDLNLTSGDAHDRGEVNIVVDFANPNRIMASSCPGGGSPDSSPLRRLQPTGARPGPAARSATTPARLGVRPGQLLPALDRQRLPLQDRLQQRDCCGRTWAMMRYSTNNGSTWTDCGRPGPATAHRSRTAQWTQRSTTRPTSRLLRQHLRHLARRQPGEGGALDRQLRHLGQPHQPDRGRTGDHPGHQRRRRRPRLRGVAELRRRDVQDRRLRRTAASTWTAPAPKTVKTRLGDWSNDIPAQCQRGIATQPLRRRRPRAAGPTFYGRLYVAMFDFNTSGCGSGPGLHDLRTSTCNYDVWFTLLRQRRRRPGRPRST